MENKNYTRQELLTIISETGFAAVDMNLYLDNNPNDRDALNTYNDISYNFTQAILDYEHIYGPLTNFGYSLSDPEWQWIDEPWPWEREFYE